MYELADQLLPKVYGDEYYHEINCSDQNYQQPRDNTEKNVKTKQMALKSS